MFLHSGLVLEGETYGVFEGVLGGDAVDFLNGVGGDIKAWWLTVINHQHLVILFISCKHRQASSVHIFPLHHLTLTTKGSEISEFRTQSLERQYEEGVPLTCLTHRSAYLSVLMVLDFPLLLFSEGRCIFSSFKVLKSSFWVFALADCSLLRGT